MPDRSIPTHPTREAVSPRRQRSRLVAASTAVALPAALLVALAPAAHASTAPFDPGTVFMADSGNNRVMELPAGSVSPTTFGATGLKFPYGLAVDAAGDVFIADTDNNRVVEVPANGEPQTTVGHDLINPQAVAVDAAGDVFIADTQNARVVEVQPGGTQSTVSTEPINLVYPTGVAVDAAGDVFIADADENQVVEVPAGGGSPTTVDTGTYELASPFGVSVDASGDVFIADLGNDQVVEVPAGGGTPTTVASGLSSPPAVAVDAYGDVFIADLGNDRVVEVQPGGHQTTVDPGLLAPWGVAVYAPPPVFTADTPPATATVGTAYSYTYAASAPTGEPPAAFRVASGTLPPGLTLDTVTGVLSGTPTTAGTYTFTVQTQNAAQATIGPPTTITVALGDTTPPMSTVRAGHGKIPRHVPTVTVNGRATFQNTSGVAVGTLTHLQCWDSHGITLTLNATDTGSGVASLSYSATGAQPIASTTASTLPVKLSVSTNGSTTVDYHATDKAGNVEPAQQQSVLVTGALSCTAPTPAFTIPRHGTATISGTVTLNGHRLPYHVTFKY